MASIFNTIEVNTGRIARIINFLSSSSEFFIAIGKSTPWDSSFGLNINDNNPPFPLETVTNVIEPILYKRIQIGVSANSIASAAARQSNCSDFQPNQEVLSSSVLVQQSITQQNFTFYTLDELINSNGNYNYSPEFVYIKGSILDIDYTESSWRVSGLYTKLFLNQGVSPNLSIYLPSQVQGGLLHHVTYNSPVLRQANKQHNFEYIINV